MGEKQFLDDTYYIMDHYGTDQRTNRRNKGGITTCEIGETLNPFSKRAKI